jgi:succinate dehydrogenase / fumarate reductase iron-sulfur subunit
VSTAGVTGLAGVQPAPPRSAADGPPDHDTINLTLEVWRQAGPDQPGAMVRYQARGISTHMSFLEMLDVVNEDLIRRGEDPIAFDHDCREGICGMCGLVINGIAHGPQAATTTCQLHMRHFRNGQTITVEPWRAGPFPVIKDLVVDRSALDRIIEAGGYISAPTGGAPDANAIPVGKDDADLAFDNAACIGCGACVAACPNASAMLFTASKLSHLAALPQGQPERERRTLAMVATQDELGFGACTNIGECSAVCPKSIPMETIARMNRDLLRAALKRGRVRRR